MTRESGCPMDLFRKKLPTLTVILLFGAGLGACGDDDGFGPEPIDQGDVAAAYEATTFTSTTDGETTDQLAEGAEFDITLNADGTTSGQLFVPGGAEDGGDFDVSLDGTWSFDGATDQVEFEHTADTFVRDMTFTAVRADGAVQLRGDETFAGTTIEVALEQQ